ncbi:sigma-70 family RNA polymerase sigma factor [Sphingobium sp. HWE2-09]|uniref:sigma-70 family RNA polymerase sigma factor n=1 Tax=Sphingobium sp. HWE2-09 TaxID=3108390 RepID=UPI002DD18126|nr:sigma-70 family RNA polymerase sigma factor [Sphingobium sp. HWE2-09]
MDKEGDQADDARARLTDALNGVARQDRSALQDVYAMTSAKLFGICLRICGDRQYAEDILQDVYVKVWRRAGQYDAARASPITWLATIARNSAIDWRRANGRTDMLPQSAAAEVADDAMAADDHIVAAQERARIFDCLKTLDLRTGAAIRAAFYDGLSYGELAVRAKVPLGTMKSWVRRGLLRLKDCIGDG